MHPVISSAQNPKVKQVLALDKARERKKQKRFVVEGLREMSHAMKAGLQPVQVFYPAQDGECLRHLTALLSDVSVLIPVENAVFEKLTYRGLPAQALAVFPLQNHALAAIHLPANPLVLVVEAIEKPGNLGALLRTADAAGVHAVLVCDPNVDVLNPNVVRSSVGALFTVPLAVAGTEEAIAWLKAQHIAIYTTHLEAARPYYHADFKSGAALVVGTEATGVSQAWVEAAEANIIIPMYGTIDSLNVSNAAAIVLFEAVRQRKSG
ncbi:MAG: RNA methyltransferase [Cryomorphaceae bacterium]|nr:MAG: RNA methyltransferase [Cryomorphaceae bacterium]